MQKLRTWLSFFKSTPTSNSRRSRVITLLAFILVCILLYLILRGLDWVNFLSILKHARYGWLPLAFIWGSLSYLTRAARWRLLIQIEKPIRLQDVFFANMVGYLGNNVLPGRVGELIRATYLGRRTQISASFILATGLVERLVDVIALIIIGSFALSVSGIISVSLQKALAGLGIVGFFSMAVMLLLPRYGCSLERGANSLPLLGEKLKLRLISLLHQFLCGLKSLLNLRRASGFILLTLLIWLIDGLGTVFSAYILNFRITLLQALVLLSGLGLSSAIPLTPGGIGVFQIVAVSILGIYAVSAENALSLTLVNQIFGVLLISVWSVIGILQTPIKGMSP